MSSEAEVILSVLGFCYFVFVVMFLMGWTMWNFVPRDAHRKTCSKENTDGADKQ